MSVQILKDRNFHEIGRIETDTSGVQTIKDANFRIKGTYDPRTNETKDANFRIVGTGNLLATLL
jgi:hypothetical protein